MRIEKLFKVLVTGALFTPALMCTSTSHSPQAPVRAAAIARTDATFDAGVLASATDAMPEAKQSEESEPVEIDQGEGVGAWLSW